MKKSKDEGVAILHLKDLFESGENVMGYFISFHGLGLYRKDIPIKTSVK